jgi:hypothetical protein
VVGMVVAYNYQPRHNGSNILLNSYSNYDQDEGHTVCKKATKNFFGSWISPDFVVLVNSLGFK